MWHKASTEACEKTELSGTDQAMDVTVRVMKGGDEIDRIIRPVRIEGGMPVVTYRKKLWRIVDGSIDIDDNPKAHDENPPEWDLLLHNLLPASLPDQVDTCARVLNACLRESLSPAVVKAAASLTALRLEHQARALLVSVLTEHRDADRLHRLLQMQLLFRERSDKAKATHNITLIPEADQGIESAPPSETDTSWEWTPVLEELEAPDVDDHSLKAAAAVVQESIGTYQPMESGAIIPDFGELPQENSQWQTTTAPESIQSQEERESALLKRTAGLGQTALEVLRYFADNPGDKAVHAKVILGYPVPDINRLLLGPLSPYMRRVGAAGCVCHSWVIEVLEELNRASNEG